MTSAPAGSDRPPVSVVIATYNRASLLPRAIASVLAQRGVELELIVVDDGSTDGTPAMLQEIRDPRLVVLRQDNRERGVARNVGVSAATSPYVAFLDSDDVWAHDHLAVLLDAAAADPEAALLHTRAQLHDDRRSRVLGHLPQAEPTGDRFRWLLSGNGIALSSAMVVRATFLAVGGFVEDRSMQRAEDWELWIRLAAIAPVRYVEAETATIHFHGANSVLDGDRNAAALREAMARVLAHPRVTVDRCAADAVAGFTRAIVRARVDAGQRPEAFREVIRSLRYYPGALTAPGMLRAVAAAAVREPAVPLRDEDSR